MAYRDLRRSPAKAGHYVLLAAAVVLTLTGLWRADTVVAQAPPAPAAASAAVLKQYCITCHNERLKSGGLVIDPAAMANVSGGADQWEKVVRKLRTQSMPP